MRAVYVHLSPEIIGDFCKTTEPGRKFYYSVEGVPSDAKFHHAYYDSERRVFCAVFEHESFDEIEEGCSFFGPVRVEVTKHWYGEDCLVGSVGSLNSGHSGVSR